jgi:hypothetical protein
VVVVVVVVELVVVVGALEEVVGAVVAVCGAVEVRVVVVPPLSEAITASAAPRPSTAATRTAITTLSPVLTPPRLGGGRPDAG